MGGQRASYYSAFGSTDILAIGDLPDDEVSSAALDLQVRASGTSKTKMALLLTGEQMDQAARKDTGYRPPQ